MGLTRITVEEVSKHLPARILSLGWPDQLHEHVSLAGSTLDVVDLIRHHGDERLVDLSYPVKLGYYDLVLDCGTLEHVSNIAQGFINAAAAVEPMGRILHEIPINMVNHGYWNISPVWFKDFYEHNGFTIERMDRTLNEAYDKSRILPWPGSGATHYYYTVPEPCCTLCVARRTTFQPISLPRCQAMWEPKEKS